MYVYMYVTPPKFEWRFNSRLTFSNTRGRLCRIYRVALSLGFRKAFLIGQIKDFFIICAPFSITKDDNNYGHRIPSVQSSFSKLTFELA